MGASMHAEFSEQRCRGGKVMAAPMNQVVWEGEALFPKVIPRNNTFMGC